MCNSPKYDQLIVISSQKTLVFDFAVLKIRSNVTINPRVQGSGSFSCATTPTKEVLSSLSSFLTSTASLDAGHCKMLDTVVTSVELFSPCWSRPAVYFQVFSSLEYLMMVTTSSALIGSIGSYHGPLR